MKEFILDMLKKSIPFVLGLFIGAGITKNKLVWFILIFYLIVVSIIRLLAKKMLKVKESVDKKIAIRNAGVETLNSAIEYMDFAFIHMWGAFDKYYPALIFIIGIGSFIAFCIFMWIHSWVLAITMFGLCILFTVLNQIWRKVKFLGEKKDGI